MAENYLTATADPARGTGAGTLAKLCMPQMGQGVIRPRIFQILDRSGVRSAIWLSSPGGAGKTTVAATYISERRRPFIWYQIDRDDADPATFFYYMGFAARQAFGKPSTELPLLTAEYRSDIAGFARRFFRNLFALAPPDTVVVLDNHQDCGGVATLDVILNSAIGEVPPGHLLIIASRNQPPPCLVRHELSGLLEVIPWDTMRLTREETALIAAGAGAGSMDEGALQLLHERCEGWAAGLILLLEHLKLAGAEASLAKVDTPDKVADYFASELFDRLPGTTRNVLLKTSVLPDVTSELARRLTGDGEAPAILEELHRRHFFTNLRSLPQRTYQYHALFREFLLARARATFPNAEFLALAERAARLLSEGGRHTDAVPLYLLAEQWETAAAIILDLAPQLLGQGRAQLVTTWIRQLPEEHIAANPWLLYWHGASHQFLAPPQAYALLEEAYRAFGARGETAGQIVAASTIVDLAYVLRWNILSTAPWLDVLQRHLASRPAFPSEAMEARVLSSLAAMLTLVRPADPQLPAYVARLDTLLDSDLDVNEKTLAAGRLLTYYAVVRGDAYACDRLLSHITPLVQSVTPANRFVWTTLASLPALMADARSQPALDAAADMIRLSDDGHMQRLLEENNLQILELIGCFYGTLTSLHFGHTDAACLLTRRMERLAAPPPSIDAAITTMNQCLTALAAGDLIAANRLGGISLKAHEEVGAMLTRLEVACIVAIERCESGNAHEAFDYLALPRDAGFLNSPRMRYQVFLIEAYAKLCLSQRTECHTALREALTIGRNHDYWGNVSWLWRILPPLCAEALALDIEGDYVRKLIRRRGLAPPDPDIEAWPWPVRIHTLGRFAITLDEPGLGETAKASGKPLQLLKALIALGGNGVRREALADILWPDAEADAGLFAFTTTLARLRKIVGDKVIAVKNNRVSLNERHCWVDTRAIGTCFDRIDQTDHEVTDGELMHRILSLYQGPFLHDEDEPWLDPLRDRLRSKFCRVVVRHAQALKQRGECSRAADLWQRAVEADPGCERLLNDLAATPPL